MSGIETVKMQNLPYGLVIAGSWPQFEVFQAVYSALTIFW